MKINVAGLALIKTFEGLRLDAYRCPAGIPTVGYGHTGSDVRIPMTITPGEAERLLLRDLARFEAVVAANAEDASENQFSAMVCLAFNIGPGRFLGSSVLRRHNAGNHAGAADAFLMWNKAGRKVLAGLIRRREAERALYLGEVG